MSHEVSPPLEKLHGRYKGQSEEIHILEWYDGTVTVDKAYADRCYLEGQASLKFYFTYLNDTGDYECKVSAGFIDSGFTFLAVSGRPSCYISSNKQAVEGHDIALKCFTDGTPDPTITWLRNNETLTSSEWYNISDDGATMNVNVLRREDSGEYTCVVSNLAVVDACHETVDVWYYHSPRLDWYKGQSEEIHILEWYDGTVTVDEAYADRCYLEGQASLKFYFTYLNDTGDYECKVSAGFIDSGFTFLAVSGRPSCYISSNKQAVEGHDIALKCFTDGTPDPTITWLRNNETLTSSERYNISDDGATLNVNFLRREDSGEYTCVVSNVAGVDACHETVDVWYDPEYVNITGQCDGSDLCLTCSSHANPTVESYGWIYDGYTGPTYGESITIANWNGYNVTCIAANEVGTSSNTIQASPCSN
ncbi:cell adhesion molecule CEACAM5-like, partial [Saccoglossus kowalevskii]